MITVVISAIPAIVLDVVYYSNEIVSWQSKFKGNTSCRVYESSALASAQRIRQRKHQGRDAFAALENAIFYRGTVPFPLGIGGGIEDPVAFLFL
jgi:hypothetical protein